MPDTQTPLEVAPQEVRRRIDAGERCQLIDVREPAEHQQARIDGALLIPMNTVPARLQEIEALADEGSLFVYCHHGIRSLNVVNWLRQRGVEGCQSIAGGIDRWSREIDPSVPRYY
jgi:rhodanese-related sulfurtransferase